MANFKTRLMEYEKLMHSDVIDLKELRKLCSHGIPDEKGYRPWSWKLLLSYLPLDKSKRNDTLNKKRKQYENFINEMIVEPALKGKNSSPEVEDHPLNPSPDSQWQSFFDDNLVLAQIDKDVRRLYPEMEFFQRATSFPCLQIVGKDGVERLHQRVRVQSLSSAQVIRKAHGIQKIEKLKRSCEIDSYQPLREGTEAHWEVVERILFIYAKLNPGQSYVQGMNEIIGPLYYIFATDPSDEFRRHAEADTFFCFIALMGEIRDIFIKTLDKSLSGIGFLMARLMNNLKYYDEDLFHLFQNQSLKPEFYSFRWITVLLSQEFDLPEVIQIWDRIFSSKDRIQYLLQICTAMIVLQRDILLTSDFASNVKLLQDYPPCDIREIIQRANELPEQL